MPDVSDKQLDRHRDLILVENDKIISKEKEVAEKMNDYFIDIVEDLEIECFNHTNSDDIEPTFLNEIENIIYKYKNHPSILKIKEHVHVDDKFSFMNTTTSKFKKDISLLNIKVSSVENDIPSN